LRGLGGVLAVRSGGNGFCSGRLWGFHGSSLLDGSAVTEKARAEENCGECESRNDSERKIAEFGQWQQGRPLKLGLNEIIVGPGGGASDRDGLRVDLRL